MKTPIPWRALLRDCIVASGAVHMLSAAPVHAVAAPAVMINFSGTYVPNSCVVVGNADQTVALPVVSAAALGTAGATAGSTPFHIPVQCDNGVAAVRAYFEAGPTADKSTGNLVLQSVSGASGAAGVQIQLLNADGSVIKVGDKSTIKSVAVGASGRADLPYIARYYATGAAGAGAVSTYVTYTLEMP